MSDPESPETPDGGASEPAPRSVPMAAIAGAVILVGLVAFALYRRHATTGGAPEGGATAPAAAATGPDTAADGKGAIIAAQPPVRLSPEAAILAERYRCVCGCNDTLTVCTCKLPKGSDEMKKVVQEMAAGGLSPERADQAMLEKYGPGVLLKNPAPPQTRPSHASEAAAAAH